MSAPKSRQATPLCTRAGVWTTSLTHFCARTGIRSPREHFLSMLPFVVVFTRKHRPQGQEIQIPFCQLFNWLQRWRGSLRWNWTKTAPCYCYDLVLYCKISEVLADLLMTQSTTRLRGKKGRDRKELCNTIRYSEDELNTVLICAEPFSAFIPMESKLVKDKAKSPP